MKRFIFTLPFLFTSQIWAAQCQVDLKNEIRLGGQQLEIHQANGETAILDDNDNLVIHGEKIELDAGQKEAIAQYRQHLNDHLPRAKQIAEDGLNLANDIIDDVAKSLDSPEAFDSVKVAMKDFWASIEARYYKNGDLILPAESFESMSNTWMEDFAKAKDIFNDEFITSAFEAMSTKMKEEGGLNLTEMANSMTELKARISERIESHSADIEQQGQEFCDSLNQMAEEEQQLHKKIPELKNYQIFTI
ncbi:YggN family protein [Vibrio sp. TRT 21S02]|uniref:YggN family protein n=1 Tax=Vibrio sp. TRT 21S02 TaxID=3418507 RepID=UPI003CE6B41C